MGFKVLTDFIISVFLTLLPQGLEVQDYWFLLSTHSEHYYLIFPHISHSSWTKIIDSCGHVSPYGAFAAAATFICTHCSACICSAVSSNVITSHCFRWENVRWKLLPGAAPCLSPWPPLLEAAVISSALALELGAASCGSPPALEDLVLTQHL